MDSIEKYVHDFLLNFQSSELFVACSGGVDSMLLLALAKKYHPKVNAVHVNYRLRGKESDLDEELVTRVCKENSITLFSKKSKLKTILKNAGGNLQDLARKERYEFFSELTHGKSAYILLAHHFDDQIETFLLNIARKSGIAGLAAMSEQKGPFLRPFLTFSKDEIYTEAKKLKIEWREDKSNSDSKYNRNKLRNIILPELLEKIPTLKESISILVSAFQENQKEVELKIKPLFEEIKKKKSLNISTYEDFTIQEKIELLRQLKIQPKQLEEIDKLTKSEKGRFIEISDTWFKRIIKEENQFYFLESEDFTILPKLIIEEVSELPSTFSKYEIYLDLKKIKGSLQLRTWQIGDRISPVGLNGSKLISDVLNDAKIPNHLRSQQLVVQDEEKILWCVGHSISREAIAGKDSTIIKVSATNI